MRRFALILTGLASLAGIISILSMLFLFFVELIDHGQVYDTDPLVNLWLILPTIFVCFIFWKLWKEPDFYKEYKCTILIVLWGFIATLLLSGGLFLVLVLTRADGFAYLAVIGLLILGAILTLLAGSIAFFYRLRSKRK